MAKKFTPERLAFLDIAAETAGAAASGIGAFADTLAARRASRINARMMEGAADDALARGETLEQQSQRDYGQLKGAARASMAARNLALDEGTPAAVIAGIEQVGREEAAIIRENALREARGYQVQAYNQRASRPGFGATAGTLLTGAGRVASRWYQYRKAGITPRWS